MPDADIVSAVVAALAAGSCFLVLAVITRGGLGLGDVKLAVLIGALLGFHALAALFWGVIAGGLVIFVLYATGVVGRKEPCPTRPSWRSPRSSSPAARRRLRASLTQFQRCSLHVRLP